MEPHFFKHVFCIRRRAGRLDSKPRVEEFMRIRWPGRIHPHTSRDPEELMLMALSGEADPYDPNDQFTADDVERLNEGAWEALNTFRLRLRFSQRPLGGHPLVIDSPAPLSREMVQAHISTLDDEALESLIDRAKIRI